MNKNKFNYLVLTKSIITAASLHLSYSQYKNYFPQSCIDEFDFQKLIETYITQGEDDSEDLLYEYIALEYPQEN